MEFMDESSLDLNLGNIYDDISLDISDVDTWGKNFYEPKSKNMEEPSKSP